MARRFSIDVHNSRSRGAAVYAVNLLNLQAQLFQPFAKTHRCVLRDRDGTVRRWIQQIRLEQDLFPRQVRHQDLVGMRIRSVIVDLDDVLLILKHPVILGPLDHHLLRRHLRQQR